MRDSIVITGCGWVTPFVAGGIDLVLKAGANFAPVPINSQGYCPVPDDLLAGCTSVSPECRGDPGAWLTAVAFECVRSDASLVAGSVPPERVGLVLGNALAGQSGMIDFANDVREQSPRFVSPIRFPQTVGNYITGALSRAYDVRGPNSTIASGLASCLAAIVEGCALLSAGKADVIFAGGTERLTPALAMGLAEPDVVFSDGACLFALERADHAAQRGATVLATILSLGSVVEPPSPVPGPIPEPLSPLGGSDEPTEGQTMRPRRERPVGSEGRVRGSSDVLAVGHTESLASEPIPSVAGSRESGAIFIEHWIGRCLGALGAAAVAGAIGAARGFPVPFIDGTGTLKVTAMQKRSDEPLKAVVTARADTGHETSLSLLLAPMT